MLSTDRKEEQNRHAHYKLGGCGLGDKLHALYIQVRATIICSFYRGKVGAGGS